MIPPKAFDSMIAEIASYDSSRETVIKKARDVLKMSKQLIYSLHRNEKPGVKDLMAGKKDLDKLARSPALRSEGAYREAAQEYAEAMCYHSFIQETGLPSAKDLDISVDDYLMGLCDLTGELSRRAVREAISRNAKDVDRIKAFLEDLEGQLIRFDFRNGELRRKFDAVKWNLKKVEEVRYDLR